jgi:hypothetical protein
VVQRAPQQAGHSEEVHNHEGFREIRRVVESGESWNQHEKPAALFSRSNVWIACQWTEAAVYVVGTRQG